LFVTVVVTVVVVTIGAIAVGPVTVALEVATVMLVTDVPDRVVGPVPGLSHRGHGEGRDGGQSHHCLGQS